MKVEKLGEPETRSDPKWPPCGIWQYYVETHFAWKPTLLDTGGVFPTIVWMRHYWVTYPLCDGKPVRAKDVLPDQYKQDDQRPIANEEMYRVVRLDDPRK